MEFKAKKKTKKFYIKKFFIFIGTLILIFTIGVEIYSPFYLNNYQDLDINAEVARIGGDFYTKDDNKMYYAEYNAQKPDTLIFIHGYGESSFTWRLQIAKLAASYHIITFDLFGFGMSQQTKSKNIGLDFSADVISSFITEKKLQNVTIIAHSMGGIVAQRLAIKNQNDISGLIFINTIDAKYMNSHGNILKPLVNFPLIKNPFAMWNYSTFISNGVKQAYYNKALVDKLVLEGYEKPYRYKGSVDESVKFLNSKNPEEIDLSQIKQLSLFYASDNDEVINSSVTDNIAKKIPNSTVIHIPKSGHLLVEEQSDLINDGIGKWVQEIKDKANIG